jgi:hypothetical protein
MRKRGEIMYSRESHTWQYGACALHAGYLGLQTHTHTKTHTHSQHAMLIALPLHKWLHEKFLTRSDGINKL